MGDQITAICQFYVSKILYQKSHKIHRFFMKVHSKIK